MGKSAQILANPLLRPSQSKINKFDKWLKYLTIINEKQENKEILFNYFFDSFASSPESFYLFLEYFKIYLQSHPNSQDLAKKYLDILSPLCERFNFFEEKNLLNDLCFKIIKPDEYQKIKQIFSKYEQKSHKITKTILKTLEKSLKGKDFNYQLIGRYKNIYSIHKKIKKNGLEFLKLNDIFAFRIILESNSYEKCFELANILHDKFYPIPDLFKDYINIPKINGYQSLHTGLSQVIPNLDLPIEIQIRTREMNDFAENGLAAHWLYSKEKKSQFINEKEQQLLNYFSCIAHSSKTDQYVYCFTNNGDILKLAKKSTILDFAYKIHSDLANKAKYALVNNLKKSIYYQIKNGDQIKIIKAEDNQIEKKWLKHTHTKYAHKKIHEYFKSYASQVH